MKTTKSPKTTVPDQLKKLFIVSTVLLYGASILMNLAYMLTPDGMYAESFVQLLLMSIPLVLAVVVYLSRSDRRLNLHSLFAILVSAFSLFSLYIAFATVATPLLIEISYNDALGSDFATTVGGMYLYVNTVIQLAVTAVLAGGFFAFATKARKRGEW